MQDRRENVDEIEIDLVEIFGLILHWLWLIGLSAIVCGIVGFVLSAFVVTPIYQSTTKIYILNRQNGDSLTYTDTQLASQLTKDYEELVTSRTVLEEVISTFRLDEKYNSLAGRTSVSNTANTRIIAITVKDPDPVMAKNIANAIRDVAAKHIQAVMDIEAVNIVDEANLPDSPVSPSVPKWTVIAALLGGLFSAGMVILRYLLDDTIKTSDDIEKHLGLSTLALIPVIDDGVEQTRKKTSNRPAASGSASQKAAAERRAMENAMANMEAENVTETEE